MTEKIKKIVLAYSGGLDTSIIIPWLKENYEGAEVIGQWQSVSGIGTIVLVVVPRPRSRSTDEDEGRFAEDEDDLLTP